MEDGDALLLPLFLLHEDELTIVGGDGMGGVPAWSGFQHHLVGVGLREVNVATCVVLDALEVAKVEGVGLCGLVTDIGLFYAAG